MLDIALAIGVPLLAGIVLTLWRSIAISQKKLSLESSGDIALDMIFLALGSSGAVFNDPKVRLALGEKTIAVLLGLVFADLIIASVLFYRRRFAGKAAKTTFWQAAGNLLLGTVSLLFVAGVIYAGLLHAKGYR